MTHVTRFVPKYYHPPVQCNARMHFYLGKGKGIEQKKRPSRDQSGKLQFHIWRHSSGWWRTEGDKITVGVDTHLLRDDVDNNNSTQVGM